MALLHQRKMHIVVTTWMPHDTIVPHGEDGRRGKLAAVFNLWSGLGEAIVQLDVAIAHGEVAGIATSQALVHMGQEAAINGDIRTTQ